MDGSGISIHIFSYIKTMNTGFLGCEEEWSSLKNKIKKKSKLFHFQTAIYDVAHQAGIEQVSSDWWPLTVKFIVFLSYRNYLWDLQTNLGI